jgi:hypothetical protein
MKQEFEHEEITKYRQYEGGDCYSYNIECKCGLVISDWFSDENLKKFTIHIMVHREMNKNNILIKDLYLTSILLLFIYLSFADYYLTYMGLSLGLQEGNTTLLFLFSLLGIKITLIMLTIWIVLMSVLVLYLTHKYVKQIKIIYFLITLLIIQRSIVIAEWCILIYNVL